MDTTFGGDGIVEVDNLQSNFDGIIGVALDPEGRIVIAGSVPTGGSVAVLRLTAEGYPDATFSGDGIAKPYVVGYANPVTMAVQQDGKIVIAGYTSSDSNYNLMVCRVLDDGNLDSSFATAGKLVMDLHGGPDIANSICLRPDGKIVVAGVTRTQPGNNDEYDNSLFVGLDQNGALDTSFGTGGIVEIAVSENMDSVSAATLMPDGRIITSCKSVASGGGYELAAIRLMPDGLPDQAFGSEGIVRVPNAEGYAYDRAWDIARDSSGGILTIGLAYSTEGQCGMLVRMVGDPDTDGDGVVDASETNTGVYVSPFDTGTAPNNSDTDGDGLSDGEEAYRFLTKPLVPDTDGDGFLDGYEVQTGKSPTDPLDKPALVAEARTAIEFSFPSALGKTYRIEDSHDMESWGTVESGITGNGGTITRFYSTRNKEKRFFRVEESTSP
jgi:uncharacterized delta-60 repeat protein